MSSLLARDAQVLWHPATHFCDAQILPHRVIKSAKGSWLHPEQGPNILDAISSWWTCLHGHGCPELVNTLHEQAKTLDHVMFAGFTHEPAVELASALIRASVPGFERVFFSDCGSASVEVALKIAFQYHAQQGNTKRTQFCALLHSYHGETLGALSVCGPSAYRKTFSRLLPDTIYLPSPHCPDFVLHKASDAPNTLREQETQALAQSQAIFEEHGSRIAALILEPLVQCAGKFRMHSPSYLAKLVQLARAHGILVICDEIAVGFGRCQKLFASQWAQIEPDFMCLSKGLSGGMMPLAATLVRQGISQAFAEDPSRSFLHSHTFCGNPMACALGLTSLSMLEGPAKEAERAKLALALDEAAQALASRSRHVKTRRQCGSIVAFDLEVGDNPRPGRAIRKAALEEGLLLRPLHDVLYWMPPYCISSEEIEHMLEGSIRALDKALG